MREKAALVGNYVLFVVFTTLLAAFQVSLWFQFLGTFPAPQMWVPPLVFWFLYREPIEGVAMTYLLSGLLATQTSLPFASFLLICLVLFAVAFFIKQRFYWAGVSFYTVMCGACCFLFLILEFSTAYFLDDLGDFAPPLMDWIFSPVFTMVLAMPLYFLFHIFDKFCSKTQPREVTGGVH